MAEILVVDDQKVIRQLLYSVLTNRGHRVTLARHGREALGFCEAHRYDLIILDYRMPGMDGLEVAERLGQEVRFILHTSDYGDRDIKVAAMKLGAVGVVPKITGITDFIEHVEVFLQRGL